MKTSIKAQRKGRQIKTSFTASDAREFYRVLQMAKVESQMVLQFALEAKPNVDLEPDSEVRQKQNQDVGQLPDCRAQTFSQPSP